MTRRAATVLLLAALAFATPRAAPAIQNNGELRVLVILATWGPQPFTREQAQDVVFVQSDAFVRDNSYGAAHLAGEVTPWVTAFASAPGCGTPTEQKSFATAAHAAAKAAGFDVASYTRFIFLFPNISTCGYLGYGSLTEVFLNGYLDRGLVTHELGHTFGLEHAHMHQCTAAGCETIEYGDPYDTMGQLVGEYNAYEKFVAGWLTNVTQAPKSGDYVIDQLELKSTVPQALDVQTAHSEYWFDHREPLLRDVAFAGQPVVQGLAVHAGPPSSDPTAQSNFSTANTLLPNPGGHGNPILLPGDIFSERGAFRLTVTAHTGTQIAVHFEWTDTKSPSKPALSKPPAHPKRNRAFLARWEPSTDDGSGVDHYTATLDGRVVKTVAADFKLPTQASVRPTSRGSHTLRVVAVDRAGNKSRPSVAKFSVR